MGIEFTKMHGLGNDFIVIDGVNQSVQLEADLIQRLANRHRGIGFDQCLLVEKSQQKGVDFNYRIFNADGHEVGQCGNGARCLARFLQHYGLTDKTEIRVATKTTIMNLLINADKSVRVDMGHPNLKPRAIPLIAENQQDLYTLQSADGQFIRFHAVNVGNPHAVIKVEQVDDVDVARLGRELSEHATFPEQTNVGFMEMLSKHHIKLRVYERGCGETQACGSGAVAAAAVARLFYEAGNPLTVSLPGGDLQVDWPAPSDPIALIGPASFVYEGQVMLCE